MIADNKFNHIKIYEYMYDSFCDKIVGNQYSFANCDDL